MGTVIYREDLDESRCANPHCTDPSHDLTLSAVCHPRSGLRVVYSKGTGRLRVLCLTCERPALVVQVARRKKESTP